MNDEPTYEALRAENAALRARVNELERALTEREVLEDTLTEHERRVPYRKIFDAIPVGLGVYRRDGLSVAMNRNSLDVVGGVKDEIIGKFNILTDPASISMGFVANFERAAAERANITMPPTSYDTSGATLATIDDRVVWTETTYIPIQGDDGTEYVVEFNIDVTSQQRAKHAIEQTQRAEAENVRLQEEIIRMQEETLRALSTPLIPIAESVVVMPLIGNVNSKRAQQVIETLLEGVTAHRAAVAILDVTGVPVVDAEVANGLLQAAQAVSLLGAEVVLTGIRPEIARTLVELGTDLRGLVTRSTLQSGVEHALRRSAGSRLSTLARKR
ncbi:STAS domain-containing protein [Polyangium sp. 15x6]|uniref:STAS domain-containing protein n=1 Tax=Polyangium sp. 15x6 TaxID=3042687 RepID=UPI002499DED0|nr:STAS domain-containing protein [Polyangium sp. 15x6]MDI3289685.1 STAS domain-containing protein [Polyangium sp. 15x6]